MIRKIKRTIMKNAIGNGSEGLHAAWHKMKTRLLTKRLKKSKGKKRQAIRKQLIAARN